MRKEHQEMICDDRSWLEELSILCRQGNEAYISLSCAKGLIPEASPWIAWSVLGALVRASQGQHPEELPQSQSRSSTDLLATALSAVSAVTSFLAIALLQVHLLS